MGRRSYRDELRHFIHIPGDMVDRVLDEHTQSVLRLLPGQPLVRPTYFATSMDWKEFQP